MTNKECAEYGRLACSVGGTDGDIDTDPQTCAADTIANVLHFLSTTTDGNPLAALESARGYFQEESE